MRVEKRHLDKLGTTSASVLVNEVIDQHEVGLLFVDGELAEKLEPGRHAFWAVGRKIRIVNVDLPSDGISTARFSGHQRRPDGVPARRLKHHRRPFAA